MVASLFGWSADDIVKSIKILTRTREALKRSGGAVSVYTKMVAFLVGFETMLRRVKEYMNRKPQAKYSADIKEHIKLIVDPCSRFETYMLEFCPALRSKSAFLAFREAPQSAIRG